MDLPPPSTPHPADASAAAQIFAAPWPSDTDFGPAQILESITDGFVVLDHAWRYTFVNRRAAEILQRPPAELVGRVIWELSPHLLADPFYEACRRAVDEQVAVRLESFDASLNCWIENRIYPGPRGISILFQDVSERILTARKLEESEERYRSLFEFNRDSVHSFDLEGRFIETNRSCFAISGYTPEELRGTPLAPIVVPEDRARVSMLFERVVAGEAQAFETQIVAKDGRVVPVEVELSPIVVGGAIVGIYSTARDVSARKQSERELQESRERAVQDALYIAEHDPLTGLLNHPAFHRQLGEVSDRLRTRHARAWLVVLDVDNFKFFNEVYGHATGDEVLRQVAVRLTRAFGSALPLARFGGDEFALILEEREQAAPAEIARTVRTRVGDFAYCPRGCMVDVPITISVGAALLDPRGASRLDVLNLADERLRQSKIGTEDSESTQKLLASLSAQIEGFSMLYGLVTAVDNKDRYTRHHSEDVMNLSVAVAEELGLNAAMRHTIAVSALLHDVGKIGVPDNILRKPGSLTAEERVIVNNHAEMGAIIVSAVPGLEATLDGVRHHHERWDGKGYPAGLAGTDIPLMARIMAVVDAYSAMTTNRPYRRGMAPERAVAILKEGAGTQWDADCVAAFVRRFEAGFLDNRRSHAVS